MRLGVKKGIITVLFILCTGALFTGCDIQTTIGPGTHILRKADAKEFNVTKAPVDNITSIDIRAKCAKVEFIPSDGFSVEIHTLYWEDQPEYSIKNGKLHFDDSVSLPDSYSINFDPNNSVIVYLPKDAALDRISVRISSGDADLSGFITKDMDITLSYGDLSIEKAAAAQSDITLSCGDSNIRDFQVGELDFTNSYGDSDFSNINSGETMLSDDISYDNFSVNLSSGNLTINTLSSKTVSIDNSYGDVTCDQITSEDFQAGLSSGDLKVSKSDLKEIETDNSYGDADFNLTGSAKDYSLDLSNSYGEITVGNQSYEDELVQDNGGTRKIEADLSCGDVTINFEE